MTPISGRKAASAALLLVLSTFAATAQTVSDDPANTPGETVVQKSSRIQVPSAEPTTTGSTQKDPKDSLARDAIRVPAFGTTEPKTLTLAEQTQPPSRKRPRVVVRRAHMQMMDMPPPYYAQPPYYRFGYGYGPGIRLYRW